MLTRIQLALILALAVGIWAVVLFFYGVPLSWDFFAPFSITLFLLTVVLVAFEKKAWHWWIWKSWLVKRPKLSGTWRVKLESSYRNPQTNQPIDPIDCVMVIRQSYARLSLRLLTKESSSVLLADSIRETDDGSFEVFAVYQNDPQIDLRADRSPIHYGALKLSVHDDPPSSLTGHYWTDRNTNGKLTLSDRKDDHVATYEAGAALYGFDAE